MGKILVIGQAPPAVKQTIPYDTTLLYEMLSWVGISKEQAQDIFEWEAMTNKFPGFGETGHKPPTKEEMKSHYRNRLRAKIIDAEKIILLGAVAKENCKEFGLWLLKDSKNVLCLIHPSKRNYSAIMEDKINIESKLRDFLPKS